jgi:hypothetical protein
MYDMFILDMGGHNDNVEKLKQRWPHARVTRYNNTHLESINRCVKHCRTSHVWIIASCCDYDNFDFDWEPVPWEAHQVHCWASGDQKLGDTFLVPKQGWTQQYPLEKLEYYRDVNYHEQGVPRLVWPVQYYSGTDLINTIQTAEFESVYQWFLPTGSAITGKGSDPALWTENHHQLVSFCPSNAISLVPRSAKFAIKTQVYDYPYLYRTKQINSNDQDIVFISYDETNAEENWQALVAQYPGAKRVHGVEGMENALRAAAQASTTPWFYAVFAKTRLHEDWKFDYQPDYWQSAKHYIFYAHNTSNDLIYGEMGVIMYHTQTVIDSPPFEQLGLDFTMSFETVVVPRVSAYGDFATDPYRAWRTAFRETVKLCRWYLDDGCVETRYRIHVWRTQAHGPNAEWVLRGANDGARYFEENVEDTSALKKTFRWDWLKNYFDQLGHKV